MQPVIHSNPSATVTRELRPRWFVTPVVYRACATPARRRHERSGVPAGQPGWPASGAPRALRCLVSPLPQRLRENRAVGFSGGLFARLALGRVSSCGRPSARRRASACVVSVWAAGDADGDVLVDFQAVLSFEEDRHGQLLPAEVAVRRAGRLAPNSLNGPCGTVTSIDSKGTSGTDSKVALVTPVLPSMNVWPCDSIVIP